MIDKCWLIKYGDNVIWYEGKKPKIIEMTQPRGFDLPKDFKRIKKIIKILK